MSSFTLAPADGALLPAFRPGQFVGLRMEGATRSYSLINAGRPPPSAYRIAVRRVEGGNVSDAMVRRLAVGDRIDLQAPGGSFTMPERNEFPLVLIAGGIGITPFLSYLETLTGSTTEPQVFLHHVCRDAAHQPFAIRLATLTRALPNVSMITHLTRPQLGDRFDYAGRFSVVRIDNALIRSRARFFICATDAMMEEVTAALRARGVPPFEIFQERFRSPQPMPVSDCTQHRIHFTSTGHVLTWTPAAGSILDLAEVAGISMRSGCRVGQCESCAVKLRSGTVRHMIECPDVEGQCLTCLAIPTSDLVIEA